MGITQWLEEHTPTPTGRQWQRMHGWATWFWIANIPLVFILPQSLQVKYLIFVSVWALVASHVTAWAAHRSEVQAQEAKEVRGAESAA